MLLVHEKLYQSESLSKIDFADYVRDLTAQIGKGTMDGGPGVAFDVRTDRVDLPIDSALPAGMILVELLTNVVKHAYPTGSGTGTVQVSRDASMITIRVEDEGVGFPASLDPTKSETLGWRLMRMLVSQVEGSLMAENKQPQGTRVDVSFRIPSGRD
jgi:two-component sensor histidine kinase